MTIEDPPWKKKTRPCPFYSQGRCLFADGCNFLHTVRIRRPDSVLGSGDWDQQDIRLRIESPTPAKTVRFTSPRRSPRTSSLLLALGDVIQHEAEEEEGDWDEGESGELESSSGDGSEGHTSGDFAREGSLVDLRDTSNRPVGLHSDAASDNSARPAPILGLSEDARRLLHCIPSPPRHHSPHLPEASITDGSATLVDGFSSWSGTPSASAAIIDDDERVARFRHSMVSEDALHSTRESFRSDLQDSPGGSAIVSDYCPSRRTSEVLESYSLSPDAEGAVSNSPRLTDPYSPRQTEAQSERRLVGSELYSPVQRAGIHGPQSYSPRPADISESYTGRSTPISNAPSTLHPTGIHSPRGTEVLSRSTEVLETYSPRGSEVLETCSPRLTEIIDASSPKQTDIIEAYSPRRTEVHFPRQSALPDASLPLQRTEIQERASYSPRSTDVPGSYALRGSTQVADMLQRTEAYSPRRSEDLEIHSPRGMLSSQGAEESCSPGRIQDSLRRSEAPEPYAAQRKTDSPGFADPVTYAMPRAEADTDSSRRASLLRRTEASGLHSLSQPLEDRELHCIQFTEVPESYAPAPRLSSEVLPVRRNEAVEPYAARCPFPPSQSKLPRAGVQESHSPQRADVQESYPRTPPEVSNTYSSRRTSQVAGIVSSAPSPEAYPQSQRASTLFNTQLPAPSVHASIAPESLALSPSPNPPSSDIPDIQPPARPTSTVPELPAPFRRLSILSHRSHVATSSRDSMSSGLLSPIDLYGARRISLASVPGALEREDSFDSGYAEVPGPEPLRRSPPRSPRRLSTLSILSSPFGSPSVRMAQVAGVPSLFSPRFGAFASMLARDDLHDGELGHSHNDSVDSQLFAREDAERLASEEAGQSQSEEAEPFVDSGQFENAEQYQDAEVAIYVHRQSGASFDDIPNNSSLFEAPSSFETLRVGNGLLHPGEASFGSDESMTSFYDNYYTPAATHLDADSDGEGEGEGVEDEAVQEVSPTMMFAAFAQHRASLHNEQDQDTSLVDLNYLQDTLPATFADSQEPSPQTVVAFQERSPEPSLIFRESSPVDMPILVSREPSPTEAPILVSPEPSPVNKSVLTDSPEALVSEEHSFRASDFYEEVPYLEPKEPVYLGSEEAAYLESERPGYIDAEQLAYLEAEHPETEQLAYLEQEQPQQESSVAVEHVRFSTSSARLSTSSRFSASSVPFRTSLVRSPSGASPSSDASRVFSPIPRPPSSAASVQVPNFSLPNSARNSIVFAAPSRATSPAASVPDESVPDSRPTSALSHHSGGLRRLSLQSAVSVHSSHSSQSGSRKIPFGFRTSISDHSQLSRSDSIRSRPTPLLAIETVQDKVQSRATTPLSPVEETPPSASPNSSNPRRLKPLRLSMLLNSSSSTLGSAIASSSIPSLTTATTATTAFTPSSPTVSSDYSLSHNRLLSSTRSSPIPSQLRHTIGSSQPNSPLHNNSVIPSGLPFASAPATRPLSWTNRFSRKTILNQPSLRYSLEQKQDEPYTRSDSRLSELVNSFDERQEDEYYDIADQADETIRRPVSAEPSARDSSIFAVQQAIQLQKRQSTVSSAQSYRHSLLVEPVHAIATPRPTLLFALASDNVEEVRRVLESGEANINDDAAPQSALAFTIANDQLKNKMQMVKLLLAYGADTSVLHDPNEDERAQRPSQRNSGRLSRLLQNVDPATRYYIERADSPQTRRASALIHRSYFRPLTRVRYELIGQDRVLDQLFRVLSMPSMAPIVVLLCGPSGHGKSLLARKFGSLLDVPTHTVNMTTLQHTQDIWKSHSIAPHEAPSDTSLKEFLIENEGKRCVVVLDEIEKTQDEKILSSLLMPWEYGRCSFEAGYRHVDVSKVIWLGTSNIGHDLVFEHQDQRPSPGTQLSREEYVDLMGLLRPRVSKRLGPSLVSRVTAVLPFVAFTADEKMALAAEALQALVGESVTDMPPATRDLIVRTSLNSYIPSEGARSLYRAVSTLLLDTI